MAAIITPLAAPGLALSILCHALGVPSFGVPFDGGSAPTRQASRTCAHRVAVPSKPFHFCAAPRVAVHDFNQTALAQPASRSAIYVVPGIVEADPVPTSPPSPHGSTCAPLSTCAAAEPAVPPFSQGAVPADDRSEFGASPKIEDAGQSGIEVRTASLTGNISPALAQQEAGLLALVNRERVSRGEKALTLSPLLCRVALGHSEDMCRRNYFDHVAPAPGPQTPMDRFLAAVPQRPDRAMLGENIYYRSATDSISLYAAQSHDAFMHSPGHRANILTPQYDQCGIGIYRNPATGEYWVTEEFLTASP